MKAILASAIASTAMAELSFHEWASTSGKIYATQEEWALREKIYNQNAAKWAEHNAMGLEWTQGPNQFADLTAHEFKARYTGGYVKPVNRSYPAAQRAFTKSLRANPAEVNWVTKGAVTAVKNQQQCGSCWAFSATGSMESSVFLATGTLPELSEQQLVDCVTADAGCNGGWMDDAFAYVIANHGITSETLYPYTALTGTCKSPLPTSVASIATFTDVTKNNELALETAIVQQPISVAVEADQAAWQAYTGGIVTANCGTALDHGVLAVGYGTSGTTDYYLVKNSWGTSWGEKGYIRLGRGATYGASGLCGIQMDPSFPNH
jgi:C1A family cysteine protease